ncbi:hypothetical protein N494_09030 [Clostridium botulinum A2B7 92]|nr:hypothetical protein N494_09030 [Clostridium botulinum A2B7 92]
MIFLRAEEGTEKIYTDIDTLAIRENKFSYSIKKDVFALIIIILRIILDSFINIKILNFTVEIIIAGLIGFTFALFIGYLKIKLKPNKYRK